MMKEGTVESISAFVKDRFNFKIVKKEELEKYDLHLSTVPILTNFVHMTNEFHNMF